MTAEVRGLTRAYGDVTALDDVSLAIAPGEFVSIVGPSGCGKTTLLRLIAGFDLPTAGTVHLDGQQVSSPHDRVPPERRDIGVVFQTFALWPHMTVAQHVRFPLDHRRDLAADLAAAKAQRVEEVLAMTGLGAYRDRYPGELSGGQQQRVGLARAIAPRPRLLLMDEPLSALDAELREELRREIQTLHRLTGVSVLYVTHDQSEALSMSDTVAVMRSGTIQQLGPPEDVYHRPVSPFVARFVGRANLVDGRWEGKGFWPAGGDGVCWQLPGIAPAFRESGVVPLRPEQLQIGEGPAGLRGRVVNALFVGREMQYAVQVPSGVVHVATREGSRRQVGDVVHLSPAVRAV